MDYTTKGSGRPAPGRASQRTIVIKSLRNTDCDGDPALELNSLLGGLPDSCPVCDAPNSLVKCDEAGSRYRCTSCGRSFFTETGTGPFKQYQPIVELLREERFDSLLQALQELEQRRLLNGCLDILLNIALAGGFARWKNCQQQHYSYEDNVSFLEARVLELLLNQCRLSAQEAEDVVELFRVIACSLAYLPAHRLIVSPEELEVRKRADLPACAPQPPASDGKLRWKRPGSPRTRGPRGRRRKRRRRFTERLRSAFRRQ